MHDYYNNSPEKRIENALKTYRSKQWWTGLKEGAATSVLGTVPYIGSALSNTANSFADAYREQHHDNLDLDVQVHRSRLETMFADGGDIAINRRYAEAIYSKLDDNRFPASVRLKYATSFARTTTDSLAATEKALQYLKKNVSTLGESQLASFDAITMQYQALHKKSDILVTRLQGMDEKQDGFIVEAKKYFAEFDTAVNQTSKNIEELKGNVGQLSLGQDELKALSGHIADNLQVVSQVSQGVMDNWQQQAMDAEGFASNARLASLQRKLSEADKKDQTAVKLDLIAAIRDEKAAVIADRQALSKKIDHAGHMVVGIGAAVKLFNPELGQKIQRVSGPLVNIGQNIAGLLGVGALATINPLVACTSLIESINAVMTIFAKSGPSDLDIMLKALENMAKQFAERIDALEDSLSATLSVVLQRMSAIECQSYTQFMALARSQQSLHESIKAVQLTLRQGISSQQNVSRSLAMRTASIGTQLYRGRASKPWKSLRKVMPNIVSASVSHARRDNETIRNIIIGSYDSQAPDTELEGKLLRGQHGFDALALSHPMAKKLVSGSDKQKQVKHPTLMNAGMMLWLLNCMKLTQAGQLLNADELDYLERVYPTFIQSMQTFTQTCRQKSLVDESIDSFAEVAGALAKNVKTYIAAEEAHFNLELASARAEFDAGKQHRASQLIRREVDIALPDNWFQYTSTHQIVERRRRGGISGLLGRRRNITRAESQQGEHEDAKNAYIETVRQRLHDQQVGLLTALTRPLNNQVSLVGASQIDRSIHNTCILPAACDRQAIASLTQAQIDAHGPALYNVSAFATLIPDAFFVARAWGVGDFTFYYDLCTEGDVTLIEIKALFQCFEPMPSDLGPMKDSVALFTLRQPLSRSVYRGESLDQQVLIEEWCGLAYEDKRGSVEKTDQQDAVVVKTALPPQTIQDDALNKKIADAIATKTLAEADLQVQAVSDAQHESLLEAVNAKRQQLAKRMTDALKTSLAADTVSELGASLQLLNECHFELKALLSFAFHDVMMDGSSFLAKWFEHEICHTHKIFDRLAAGYSLESLLSEMQHFPQAVTGLKEVLDAYRKFMADNSNMVTLNFVSQAAEAYRNMLVGRNVDHAKLANLQSQLLSAAFALTGADPTFCKQPLCDLSVVFASYLDQYNSQESKQTHKKTNFHSKTQPQEKETMRNEPIVTHPDDEDDNVSNTQAGVSNSNGSAAATSSSDDAVVPANPDVKSGSAFNFQMVKTDDKLTNQMQVVSQGVAAATHALAPVAQASLYKVAVVRRAEADETVSANNLQIAQVSADSAKAVAKQTHKTAKLQRVTDKEINDIAREALQAQTEHNLRTDDREDKRLDDEVKTAEKTREQMDSTNAINETKAIEESALRAQKIKKEVGGDDAQVDKAISRAEQRFNRRKKPQSAGASAAPASEPKAEPMPPRRVASPTPAASAPGRNASATFSGAARQTPAGKAASSSHTSTNIGSQDSVEQITKKELASLLKAKGFSGREMQAVSKAIDSAADVTVTSVMVQQFLTQNNKDFSAWLNHQKQSTAAQNNLPVGSAVSAAEIQIALKYCKHEFDNSTALNIVELCMNEYKGQVTEDILQQFVDQPVDGFLDFEFWIDDALDHAAEINKTEAKADAHSSQHRSPNITSDQLAEQHAGAGMGRGL